MDVDVNSFLRYLDNILLNVGFNKEKDGYHRIYTFDEYEIKVDVSLEERLPRVELYFGNSSLKREFNLYG